MTKFFHDEWLYDLQNYHYSRALRSIKQQEEVPDLLVSLLQLMAERRELNIQPVMNQKLRTELLEATGFQLFWHEDPEDEQLANYLYDLEAKLRNEQIIDFVRAVSPAIYRIFMRLIQLKIPDITNYIHNSKESSYDRWKFESLHASDNPILQQFHSESVVNSSRTAEHGFRHRPPASHASSEDLRLCPRHLSKKSTDVFFQPFYYIIKKDSLQALFANCPLSF